MMEVKAGTVPGEIRTFSVENNASVGDVLRVAGIQYQGMTLMMDGATVSDNTPAREGATIAVTSQIKGN